MSKTIEPRVVEAPTFNLINTNAMRIDENTIESSSESPVPRQPSDQPEVPHQIDFNSKTWMSAAEKRKRFKRTFTAACNDPMQNLFQTQPKKDEDDKIEISSSKTPLLGLLSKNMKKNREADKKKEEEINQLKETIK